MTGLKKKGKEMRNETNSKVLKFDDANTTNLLVTTRHAGLGADKVAGLRLCFIHQKKRNILTNALHAKQNIYIFLLTYNGTRNTLSLLQKLLL